MSPRDPKVLGRYVLYDEIAAGGMATIHLARHVGPLGFERTVAIKKLHAQYARDPEFVAMFLDEARLASRINHPNVASMLDVVTAPEALCLVMEYLHGMDLSQLMQRHRAGPVPALSPELSAAMVLDALRGLHAAHEATSSAGEPLRLVHRDVSPHNLFVGVDGLVRVLDFGIAKATSRSQVTREGQVKGKLAYMSPEQLRSEPVDRRSDIFAVGIVLWELLTGRRLYERDDPGAIIHDIMLAKRIAPSQLVPGIRPALDEVALRALSVRTSDRYATAAEMAAALEGAVVPARREAVTAWVEDLGGERLAERRARVLAIESYEDERSLDAPTKPNVLGSSLNDALVEISLRDERAELPTAPDLVHGEPSAPVPAAKAEAPTIASRTEPFAVADRQPRGPARRPIVPVVLGVAFLTVGVALLWLAWGAEARVLSAAPGTGMAGAPDEPSATAEPVGPIPADGDAPDVAAAPTSSSSDASPPDASSDVAPPTVLPAWKPPPPPPPSPKDDCSPNYYYEGGIKRYKPHCF